MKQIQSFITFFKIRPKTDYLLLAVGLAIFVTIALLNISSASIWFDEAFSAYIVRFNYWEILQFTATDVHPPFYYWLLKAWTDLFGTTELAFRSLSVVFGALALGGTYLLARRFFGRTVGAISLLFLMLSPMLIRYSDEARMYTLAAVIVIAATAVMMRAMTTNQKRWWVLYGVLVSLGMWTHYFTALAWLAHWVWRAIVVTDRRVSLRQNWKRFFSKSWVLAHIVAVGLYLPWIPFFLRQTGTVQANGFWIGPIGIDTFTNYVTNFFYYLEHNHALSWVAVLLAVVLAVTVIAIPKTYKALSAEGKRNYLLIIALAWVAPLILVIMSLPPLAPVFVERYLIPSITVLSVFFAVTLWVGTRQWRTWLRVGLVLLVAGMMIFGITNVYKYGNFNKSSNTHVLTRQTIEKIHQVAEPGTPIVANSPWMFYEAVFYSTPDYPVYFIDENTTYEFGSLDMLRLSDMNKINDLDAFKKQNPVIWYIGTTDQPKVMPYESSWQPGETVSVYDWLLNKEVYRATEYRVSAE